MELFSEFFSIIRAMEEHHIPYAVVGGIGMAFHDAPRFTRDIDLLVLPAQMEEVHKTLGPLGYWESSKPWTFLDSALTLHRFMKVEGEDHLILDILAGADEQHKRIVDNALREKWESGVVRVARKEDIIWMKRQRGSDQDIVDIRKLSDDKD